MAADEERHVLIALVGHLVRHGELRPVDGVAGNKLEIKGILLEQLRRALELKGGRGIIAIDELELLLAGKTVASQVDLLARRGHGVVVAQTAADGEADRCLPAPNGGSPCHRYSRPLAAMEVKEPPSLVRATLIWSFLRMCSKTQLSLDVVYAL